MIFFFDVPFLSCAFPLFHVRTFRERMRITEIGCCLYQLFEERLLSAETASVGCSAEDEEEADLLTSEG